MAVTQTCVDCGIAKPLHAFNKNTDKRKVLARPYSQGCKDCINRALAHLRRLKRGADRLTELERFEQYFEAVPWSGCWIWTGATAGEKNGGGHFSSMRNGAWAAEPAYRAAWRLYRGPIPSGKWICHNCDNRLCVNPAHLFVGTPLENSHDMIAKRRHPYIALGSNHKASKLVADDVLMIRASSESLGALAKRFGVSKGAIKSIKQRQTWKHLPEAICQ